MKHEDEKQLDLLLTYEKTSGGVLKWVFAFFLLANAGLWMWNQWIREASDSDSVRARLPIAAEKMRLITEPGVKLVRRGSAPVEPPPEAKPKRAQACYRVGPFAEQKGADARGKLLAQMKIDFERREQTQNLVTGYRVALPRFSTKKAAERQRARLARLGIKDHALTQEQGGKYTISLGVYSVEANAQKRVKELKAKKIKATLQPISETRASYWLEFNKPLDGTPTDGEKIKKLKQQGWGSPDIKLTTAVCAAPSGKPSTASVPKP